MAFLRRFEQLNVDDLRTIEGFCLINLEHVSYVRGYGSGAVAVFFTDPPPVIVRGKLEDFENAPPVGYDDLRRRLAEELRAKGSPFIADLVEHCQMRLWTPEVALHCPVNLSTSLVAGLPEIRDALLAIGLGAAEVKVWAVA